MLPDTLKNYSSEIIQKTLVKNYNSLLSDFYEMQTEFLRARYKLNKSIEVSNILTLLGKNLHLEIVRQRENDLDFDISLESFLKINNYMRNNEYGLKTGYKIVSIVEQTGIPKETVRRKLKKLIDTKVVNYNKASKLYYYNLQQRNEELFKNFIERDINALSKFVSSVSKFLDLDLKVKFVENEIKNQFSFYYYHYYNCQVAWMKMWQEQIKDVDLIFISIQALIPALRNADTFFVKNNIEAENMHTFIGKTKKNFVVNKKSTISASSIAEISGIPRATCIRKLQKLVNLGMLVKEMNSKRYFINQSTSERTKNIMKKDNIINSVNIFSDLLSVIISALTRNNSKKI